EFMHLRHFTHIINLIVSEGFKDLNQLISAIQNAVRYVHSSLVRLVKFKACAEKEKIDYKGLLVLDVPTRWNSIYMILDVAIKFQKAFEKYKEEDDEYLSYFHEDDGGKKKLTTLW
ncbi:Ribonuclease H-like domain containing protein, partial [Parasponia andersonii]